MSNVFLISDTHFGHRKILEFEKEFRPFNSIEEHDEFIVNQWNKTVSKRDVVYHLGDVLFGTNAFESFSRLNGTIKLILGNHDQYPTETYLQYVNKVHGSYKFDGNILTHIPIHESQFMRFKRNIHGHLHSKRLDDDRYVNCSCEQIGLTPIAYEDLKKSW